MFVFFAVWLIVALILFSIRGYLEECDPGNSFCDEDTLILIGLWPVILLGFTIGFIIIGPFYLSIKLGRFIARHCNCFKRNEEK